MKLIGQKVMQQYPNGHNTDLDQGRIIKGFGFGGGGLKIGKWSEVCHFVGKFGNDFM